MKSLLYSVAASIGLTLAIPAADLPNILWLTSEDNGPHLGAYGDTFATTPHLDALAGKGMLYRNAWSTAPVCAPARTAIISGMYPTSTGSEHMRSLVRLPEGLLLYPQYLRPLGYYCSNNSKEDYNLAKQGKVWDDSSPRAHWKNRKTGQPFFAIFNHTGTHESQIRRRPHTPVHDPAKVPIPAYHPDTPETRLDWAQYHDQMTLMDREMGRHLKELEEAGLAESTIVFYYGDHGAGMPRSKRWPYNSGLEVPLIVYFPEKFLHLAPPEYRAGGESKRFVAFVDLAPTLLSLAGIVPPKPMQGHAFAGQHTAPLQPYLFGLRGRMDERYDLVRSVRNERYVYIRNYMPHLIYGQFISYMFETPTTRVWKERFDAGTLTEAQSLFWRTKPPEELYDLENDPDEVRNLARDPALNRVLDELRQAHRGHVLQIRDLGFLSEDELHRRADGKTPYELGQNPSEYSLERILPIADLASSLAPDTIPPLLTALSDSDSAVRYWAAMGLLMRGNEGVSLGRSLLDGALRDQSPSVRVVAARALAEFGTAPDLLQAMPVLLSHADLRQQSVFTALLALNAIDALGPKARPYLDTIKALPATVPKLPERTGGYVPRLLEKIIEELQSPG